MEPTISDGAILIIKKRYYNYNPFKRFDVVLVFDKATKEYMTKRIIGLPGEKIEIKGGNIYINDRILKDSFHLSKISYNISIEISTKIDENPFVIPRESVWVIGDNRKISHYGIYKKSDVMGRVKLLF